MAFNKKFLLGTSMIVGLAAVTFSANSAAAQTQPADAPATCVPGDQTNPCPVAGTPADQAAQAPTSSGATEGTEVQEITVTGSRIRRDATTAPAPLISLSREEVLLSGEPNVVDFLADIPALQTSVVPEDTTGSGLNDGGLSLLDLRDLGATRTLVLVDGRRHVGSAPQGLSVDVDTIPTPLVQSIEVVTGGQSALYGADAVSGVVNFILRRNFDGLQIDGGLAEINDDGQLNERISALVGRNFLDDRLNIYAFAEYQHSEEVLDLDMDWRRRAYTLLNTDTDPALNNPDYQYDNILIDNARDAFFTRGGVLTLANNVRPSSPATGVPFIPGTGVISDPDNPVTNCGAVPTNFAGSNIGGSTTCFNIQPTTANTYTFNRDGSGRLFNFGRYADMNGSNRRINVGGDGLNTGTEFGQGSRLPESTAYRFQAGLNYQVIEGVQLFGEAKYVREETYDSGQPTFFQLGIVPLTANQQGTIFAINNFNIGLNNPYLDPNIQAVIQNNQRSFYDTCQTGTRTSANIAVTTCTTTGIANPNFGAFLGTQNDPRAQLGLFGPSRSQNNTRDLQRYVIGVRGDRDTLSFINNFSYEASYTYGRVHSENEENAIDVERFAYAIDAVRNTAGQIVCRVQDLTARGIVTPDQFNGGNLSATSAAVSQCTPINVFGSDLRADANEDHITGGGGRPGLTDAQRAYITAQVRPEDTNVQHDAIAFASGELFDFWGAGRIGVAVGAEYRREETSSVGRDATAGGRTLFLNGGAGLDRVSYEAREIFGELRVPLLRDRPFIRNLEVSGAYRYSDYDLFGSTRTYSFQGQYRPTEDVLFRGTYGRAVRVPTLGDLFGPNGQTFANGLVDPCDSLNLANVADPVLRANRTANCRTLLGAGYDPNTTRIQYGSGVAGILGGNPTLQPETSDSYTYSIVLTPRFFPNFSLVFDVYDIKISNVIVTTTTQQNIDACVSSGPTLNPNACATVTRNGATNNVNVSSPPFGVASFFQGGLNFAQRRARGMDFTARYNFDLNYFDFMPRNAGRINYSLRGNYLLRDERRENPANPSFVNPLDGLVGLPRVRFLQTVTWLVNDRLSVNWDWDWQAAQEIADEDLLRNDPDNRLRRYFSTRPFNQHDFAVRYDVREDLTLRFGVVNAFDEEPSRYLGSTTSADNFDLFGRRFFASFTFRR